MKSELTLLIEQEKKIQADGTFLYVDIADGEIEITTSSGFNYSLNRWDQIQLPTGEEFKEISIRNMHSEANHIKIRTGFGKFFATGQAGSSFAVITDMPNVEFAGIQTVKIDNLPSEQAVKVNSLPAVTVEQLPEVTIEQLPEVTIKSLPSVEINNLPSEQAVKVNSLPGINIILGGSYRPSPKADFALNDYLVEQNSSRKTIGFKASPFNDGVIWVGSGVDNGIPLFAGESIELATTGEINLHAENTTDNCYISEVIV